MPRTTVVRFNNAEMKALRDLTDAIQSLKESRGIQTKKIDPNYSDWDVQFIGLKGEAGAAKFLGCKIDRRVMDGGDDGRDLRWQGRTIQVKTSRPRNEQDLIVTDSASLKTDLMFLAVTDIETPAIRLMGWIPTVEFLMLAEIQNYGYGDRMRLPASKLNPPDTLGEHARNELRWDMVASGERGVILGDDFQRIWRQASEAAMMAGRMSRARADLETFRQMEQSGKYGKVRILQRDGRAG
jgi:hypothetical protein